ncbi:MAG: 5-methyltetrahydropteroyltriglutamate--homocysteine S-methyltransferase [Lentisphaeraceae bacterium]|nr:5-methyltetrahydropteroyltriglutamate--homocysteine S-methyltransferase [Lentisphaeraceae bacterium]
MSNIKIHNLGLPRIGRNRELKKSQEKFWRQEISEAELLQTAAEIKKSNWDLQKDFKAIPVNDFSFYDQILDMSCLLGAVPERFISEGKVDLKTYFDIARGNCGSCASEMTKWFDTNYHYIVPELSYETNFRISSDKLFEEVKECNSEKARPVIIGPVTYLYLSKAVGDLKDPFELLDKILPVYSEILLRLRAAGVKRVQIDEPIFSTDLTEVHKEALKKTYDKFSVVDINILLTNYFGSLGENLEFFFSLPASGYHIDALADKSEVAKAVDVLPVNSFLSLGVIDGRNIWRSHYKEVLDIIKPAHELLGDNLWLAPTCSLLHVPYSLKKESDLNEDLKSWLSFAEEKLEELLDIKKLLGGNLSDSNILIENSHCYEARLAHSDLNVQAVRKRLGELTDSDFERKSSFEKRSLEQRKKLNLPPLPTTTIGSFPQTKEVRQNRARFKNGSITEQEYSEFIKSQIIKTVDTQKSLGLDVLVHGESERNDMVEYFGEHLAGFAFTKFGWVQSYGSRCVKPPLIYGDVYREKPITVEWSSFAKSLDPSKPMKGMLTGPVTILKWSFVRNDINLSEVAYQIALAIRDEVKDLESAGLEIIQVDEAALREGLPLRESDKKTYLDWAIGAFKLTSSGVDDETQIHTHMCYSDFNEIIESIADMDADVISIEASRSNHELLEAFSRFDYPNEIGPGVYDIHSPRVPTVDEFLQNITGIIQSVPVEKLWINPDCGLKTRNWSEVNGALQNMVSATHKARQLVK